ncbi:GNAT family N-acetyltransferase [Thermoflavimicrobium daqui]|uniref:GNAT family N-acetyltransferase n=1 Tax=Thermoflavimicrobium daqui TaxID=2137476 RepID=A0A364K4A8_9BACL|nr:GNAT family N-acetyltransferase [Thermoflavimicrobium daqui]RAL24203.1 GNAT family N-acetyltransferase [Thermoflavimicrobium daqui]
MLTRSVCAADYKEVISVLNEWWGGRQMTDMLPKLFFVHFQNTSFIIEKDGRIIGFLIGFISQTYLNEAYVHFVGVHPKYRKKGIAKRLYELFFEAVQKRGCEIVRCLTSPANHTSIAFHTKMGFQIEKGDYEVNGISIHKDYDGQGQERVLFVKYLKLE